MSGRKLTEHAVFNPDPLVQEVSKSFIEHFRGQGRMLADIPYHTTKVFPVLDSGSGKWVNITSSQTWWPTAPVAVVDPSPPCSYCNGSGEGLGAWDEDKRAFSAGKCKRCGGSGRVND